MDTMLLLKASVLLTAALVGARLLRRAPAATRHGLWSLAFAALLALPLLAPVVPSLPVAVPASWSAFAKASADRRPGASHPPAMPASPGQPARKESDVLVRGDGSRHDVRLTTASSRDSTGEVPPSWARPAPGPLLLAVWAAGTLAAVILLCVSLFRAGRLARAAEELRDPAWRGAADALGTRPSDYARILLDFAEGGETTHGHPD